MTFFSTRLGQFTYFSMQVGEPVWRGKRVLDFGGNIGNLLRDPNSTVDEERYWCLDVARESVEAGRASFPKAHWVFYDRYSFSFNPRGVRGLPVPDLGQRFDYILAFSVFTNTTPSDMLQMVGQLEGLLAEGGTLAFTFIDPFHFSWPGRYAGDNLQWRLDLEVEREHITPEGAQAVRQRTRGADWFMLVNGNDLYVGTEEVRHYEPEQEMACYAYHTEKYMRGLFPRATILPPVNDEAQHCCLIRKS